MTRASRLFGLAAAIAAAGLLGSAATAHAGMTDVTFTINSASSQLQLIGNVTGDFFATGFVSTIPLTAQGTTVKGDKTRYVGDVSAKIGFNAATTTATDIQFTGGNLDALTSGNWLPSNWDGTVFLGGVEAADYGLAVSTLVKSAIRDVLMDFRSVGGASVPITGSSFDDNFGLEFKAGFNDLDAAALGTVDRQVLRNELDSFEFAGPGVVQPNGMPYPGGIVWRQVTGTDGFGRPVFDLTPAGLRNAFSDTVDDGVNADAVRLYDGAGAEIPQLFPSKSVSNSGLVVTPTGGGNVNLGLTLDIDATGAFFLGDFLVSLQFKGAIGATGTAQFVDEVPSLVGDANGDCSVGAADYAIWAAQFGQSGADLAADFDNNGSVGAGDYALWAANFGNTCPPAAAGASVPEPSALALGVLAVLGLVGLRRRRA